MATYFNMPSWEIPWTVKPGGQESQTRLSNYTTTTVICKSRTESRDCKSQNIQPSKWIMPLKKLKIQLKERKSDYIPFRSWGPLLVSQAWTPVPKPNCFDAKEMGRRCQHVKLLRPECLATSGWQHELWILLGLPTPIPSQVYPKDGAHSGPKEL